MGGKGLQCYHQRFFLVEMPCIPYGRIRNNGGTCIDPKNGISVGGRSVMHEAWRLLGLRYSLSIRRLEVPWLIRLALYSLRATPEGVMRSYAGYSFNQSSHPLPEMPRPSRLGKNARADGVCPVRYPEFPRSLLKVSNI